MNCKEWGTPNGHIRVDVPFLLSRTIGSGLFVR